MSKYFVGISETTNGWAEVEADNVEQAKAKGLGIPDYCLKATGRWTFGYLK